jgi:hypothetical protein
MAAITSVRVDSFSTDKPTPLPAEQNPLLPRNSPSYSERVSNCWRLFRRNAMDHCYYNPRIVFTVPVAFFGAISVYCTVKAVESSSSAAAIFAGITALLTAGTLCLCYRSTVYSSGGSGWANR